MKSEIRAQSGVALLMLLIVLMGLGAFGLSKVLSSSVQSRQIQKDEETRRVLLEAKELVISYAVNYAKKGDLSKMGRLPCPDASASWNDEGNQDGNCGDASENTVGFFPFKAFGRGKMEDGDRECLWYVVSGDYKNSSAPELLNWDSVGYLNVENEDAVLQHGANAEDFPIALIISPGAILGQDRTTNAALPECGANHAKENYLEGGPNIDYTADLPDVADTVWSLLNPTPGSHAQAVDYNDRIIAVYRDELWAPIRALGDLNFNPDETVAPPPTLTPIEQLTRDLAACLVEYGKDGSNLNQLLPYPAPIAMADYRVSANYDDDVSINFLSGRFPGVVDSSVVAVTGTANFISGHSPLSPPPPPFPSNAGYCNKIVPSFNGALWTNWKDHFFYIVSEDFHPGSTKALNDARCPVSGGDCITINSSWSDKIAAVVLFAGDAQTGQSRVWNGVDDDKQTVSNYLEGDFAGAYGGGSQNFTVDATTTDYAYCVDYVDEDGDGVFELSVTKCADL